MTTRLHVPFVYKSSYDKANRSSHASFRGLGMEEGLSILAEVKRELGVPLLTDVHTPREVVAAAEVVDILQIPALLCRQTDLLLAAGPQPAVREYQEKASSSRRPTWNMSPRKLASTGNRRILLTERGASFGYHNLVSDMRSLPILAGCGYPVVYDATHSVQTTGGGVAQCPAGSESLSHRWPGRL